MAKATIQIHAFCNTSLTTYGARIYVRSELDGIIMLKLRVTPLKTQTVPKLELSAASLLPDPLNSVASSLMNMKFNFDRV